MKNYYLLHLGIGNVGRELVTQIEKSRKRLEKDFGVNLIYSGLFTSRSALFAKNGLSPLKALGKLKTPSAVPPVTTDFALDSIPRPFILIDTTTSDATIPYLKKALSKGGFAVLSNKRPLTGTQNDFDELHKFESRLFYETVVGAGLPVIQTLKNLIETGDEIIDIQGCFSGSLGYIFSQLDLAKPFSKVVLQAKAQGYTEPDPREDLSGRDVARKALILARINKLPMELKDIKLTSLFPRQMQDLSVNEFLKKLPELDKEYKVKAEKAAKANKVLRFLAKVNNKSATVGLEAVDRTSDIGSLTGPDNLIIIKTKRYFANPLIVKGPGAGIAVTAAGVFGDIISIIKKMS